MSKLIEEWKPIRGFEEMYEISDWGRIKSLARSITYTDGRRGKVQGKIMSPAKNNAGYYRIILRKNKKNFQLFVHHLVWDAFVGTDRTGLEVNHIDEDKNNNAVWNLNLLTHKANSNWGVHTKVLSKPVVAKDAEGNVIFEFSSIAEAGRNGFTQSSVSACCRDERKSHKGYFWEYV